MDYFGFKTYLSELHQSERRSY